MNGWTGLFNRPNMFGRVPDPPIPDIKDEDLILEVGDWIRCKDRDDMISTMHDLIMEGIETEFRYSRFGEKGLWLEVISVE